MANNSLPDSSGQLIGLGVKMLAGLTSLGTTLKITQITPAEFEAELNAFVTGDGDFNAARSAKQAASDAFKPADTALSGWLQITRNVLAARFGSRWSAMWAQAGFIDATTSVPRRIEERLALGLNLANFFTLNPSYEVASMNVTAAKAVALRTAALGAQQATMSADVTLKTKGDAWDTVHATLTSTMRSLIKILRATLQDNDPRWLAFGLQMPSTITTPGQPVNVTAQLDETGAIVVQCNAVPLASRYRWRMLRVGVETEYALVARSVDPVGMITSLLPGQTAQIIVQAVNGNLQSVASEPIKFTMPLVSKARTREIAPVAEERIVASTNGSNGSTNGSRLPALA
jgi:hypothetical protein